MRTNLWLRGEAAAILAAAILFIWFSPDALPLWLTVLVLIAPDIAMVGYAAGPKVGAACYNLAHSYAAPALFGMIWMGIAASPARGFELAGFWVIHIAADRLLGYGLKEPTGFNDTHLGRVGRP